MTPDQSRAVLEAAPMDVLNGVTVHGVSGLDGDRVALTATVGDIGPVTVVVPILYGPLPLAAPELLAIVVTAQSALQAALAVWETDVGRGFNNDGRGALNTSTGFRALNGYG